MREVLEFFERFKNQRGAAAVEYGIMVALIAAVIVATVRLLGTQVLAAFNTVVNALR